MFHRTSKAAVVVEKGGFFRPETVKRGAFQTWVRARMYVWVGSGRTGLLGPISVANKAVQHNIARILDTLKRVCKKIITSFCPFDRLFFIPFRIPVTATLVISGNHTESQWGSRKYPG